MKKEVLYDYFILSLRVTLAFTLLTYGYGKMTHSQFQVHDDTLNAVVKDLDLFRLSWYLFGHEPFNYFIGISQIISAVLLLYNRTAIIGAMVSFPIFLNILIIDITYVQMPNFYYRLTFYLLFDILICWHYKDKIFAAFRLIFDGISTRYKFPIWSYFLLPLMIVLIELASSLPQLIVSVILDPLSTLEKLKITLSSIF